MEPITKFATETAKILKQFVEMSEDNEEARAEFCSEISDSPEEQQKSLALLFDMAKQEMSNLRRSEKSSSKSSAETDGNDNDTKVTKKNKPTKKDHVIELLMSGDAISKKQIMSQINCDRKTVDRAIKAIQDKGKIVSLTSENEIQVAINA